MLFRLVEERYVARRSTWMTVNRSTRKQLDRDLTPQVFDRLQERCELLKCVWPSYRERAG
jgi:hypothetical protein